MVDYRLNVIQIAQLQTPDLSIPYSTSRMVLQFVHVVDIWYSNQPIPYWALASGPPATCLGS